MLFNHGLPFSEIKHSWVDCSKPLRLRRQDEGIYETLIIHVLAGHREHCWQGDCKGANEVGFL